MIQPSTTLQSDNYIKYDCGLIGLGTMGRGLARNLAESEHSLAVFDRNPDAMKDAVNRSAVAIGSLEELIASTDIIMTCLPSIQAIEAVYATIVEHARPGLIACDFSTADPQTTREFASKLREKGADLVDCPMLRNYQAAWDATLQLLVGGHQSSIDRVRPKPWEKQPLAKSLIIIFVSLKTAARCAKLPACKAQKVA